MRFFLIFVIFLINFSTTLSTNTWFKVFENSESPIKIVSYDSINVAAISFSNSGGYCIVYHSKDGGFSWNEIIT